MSASRFEIVRTDAAQPWHARFRGSNGRIVWVTENYTRRRGAENAIRVLGETVFAAFEAGNILDVDERRPEPAPTATTTLGGDS